MKMNFTKKEIRIAVFVGLGVAAVILLITFFSRGKLSSDYKKELKLLQDSINRIHEKRAIAEVEKAAIYEYIAEHKKQDSLLALKYQSNQKNYFINDKKLKTIEEWISLYGNNDDSLRRAIAEID